MTQISIEPIILGDILEVYACSGTRADFRDIVSSMSEPDQKKVWALVEFCAQHGLPHNKEKCRPVQGGSFDNLYELKPGSWRMPIVINELKIVITHVFKKGTMKAQRGEFEYANRIKKRVLELADEDQELDDDCGDEYKRAIILDDDT